MREKNSVLLGVQSLVERSQLEQVLTAAGFHVLIVEEPASLVQVAETQHPNTIVVSDDFSGSGNGINLCRHIKASARGRSASLLLICSREEARFPSITASGRPDEVLLRPLFLPEVLFRLTSMLRMQRFSSQSAEGSKIDPLTGTFNSSYLVERLGHELLRAERYGRSLALVLMDLDHFGSLNERHGTAFGDLLLREVARAITSRLRGVDLVARSGPDDFTAVLPETSLLVARPIAERLRLAVLELGEQIHDEKGDSLPITASVGISGMPHPEARDVPGLLHCARMGLARAREQGGNCSVLW